MVVWLRGVQPRVILNVAHRPMGCGCVRQKKTVVVRAHDTSQGQKNEPPRNILAEILDTTSRLMPDENSTASASRSPSARSSLSGLTSLHSSRYHYHYTYNKGDNSSEVPTISEDIANMEDFDGIFSAWGSTATQASNRGPVNIDSRQHPLAPLWNHTFSSSSEVSCCAGGSGDLTSVRDDLSVASAPLDVTVNFPPLGEYCSSGSTPTMHLHPPPSGTRRFGKLSKQEAARKAELNRKKGSDMRLAISP